MIDLILQRLRSYSATTPVEEAQAIKEVLQEVVLYVLWRAGFFEAAAFQGGTSLRILYKLPRFSEDLDFILKKPDPEFAWSGYLAQLTAGLREFGLQSEVLDKGRMDRSIRMALLKDTSIARQLNLAFYQGRDNLQLKIKLEIDVNPPAYSGFAFTYLDFPLDFEVCHQDLPSNFALKIHALLCRTYVKGRDWYDFNWYVKQKIAPNLAHLQAALMQYGPWKGQALVMDAAWLREALLERIARIDWREAAKDVERFLATAERHSLGLWNERFFGSKVDALTETLRDRD